MAFLIKKIAYHECCFEGIELNLSFDNANLAWMMHNWHAGGNRNSAQIFLCTL